MIVDHRVRAILINSLNQLVLMKFVQNGRPNHWVAPGGGFESADGSFEKALERCIRDEVGGTIEILKLLFRLEHQLEENRYAQQHFFLCRLSGGKNNHSKDGAYHIEEIPLRLRELQALDIRPQPFKRFLIDNCSGLFELPDLR